MVAGMNIACAADGIALNVSADKTIATIGTKIKYRVELVYNDPIVVVSDISLTHLSEFTIKDIDDSARHPEGEGKHIITRDFVVVPYSVGELVIHPVSIQYKRSAEAEAVETLISESIVIAVGSVIKEEADDIHAIKDIVDPKKTLLRYISYAGWGAVVLIIGFALFLLIRTIIRRLTADKDLLLTPYERTMKKLFELRQSRLIAEGRISEFTDKISDIVRWYLGVAFTFETMDLTTSELNARCAEVGVEIEVHNRLITFLQDCDLVKFARHMPDTAQLDQLFTEAKELAERINTITKDAHVQSG